MRCTLALTALLLVSCASVDDATAVSPSELEERIRALGTPALVVLWADWSRASVELMPTVGELAAEYEGRGVQLIAVRLGEGPPADSSDGLGGLPAGMLEMQLAGEPTFLLARYGVGDVPAALGYSAGADLLFTLQSADHAPLTPADLADAIESLIATSGE